MEVRRGRRTGRASLYSHPDRPLLESLFAYVSLCGYVRFITGHVHAQCAKSSLIRKYLLV